MERKATSSMIKFPLKGDKVVAMIMHILEALGATEKIKLVGLLYVADRNHFLQHFRPISGASLIATAHGPAPSESLDMINHELNLDNLIVHSYVRVKGHILTDDCILTCRDGATSPVQLSETELAILNATLKEYGHKSTSEVVDETSQLTEYSEIYDEESKKEQISKPISYSRILQLYSKTLHGRPVIPSGMMGEMVYPFVGDGYDL